MAYREFVLEPVGVVRVYKHRAAKNVRITLGNRDYIRVTVPAWSPYRIGFEFAKTRRQWIEKHHKPKRVLASGDQVGKSHQLFFIQSDDAKKVKSSRKGNELYVKLPQGISAEAEIAQAAANKAAYSALRAQAENLLPQQLAILANKYGFTFRSVRVRRLKSRWGSCNQHKDIILNTQLMQLPWELINYVLLHELVHTKVLRHGTDFWAELTKCLPKARQLQKELRKHQTAL